MNMHPAPLENIATSIIGSLHSNIRIDTTHATGFAYLNGPTGLTLSSSFIAQPKQCRARRATPATRAARVSMAARRPGSRRMSYYNNVRSTESPKRYQRNGNVPPSTTEGNGVPATVGGNGVAYQDSRTALREFSSEPDIEKTPARSLPVNVFGFRFNVSGRLLLLAVPFLWSSYGICLKWLYQLEWAVSVPVFNALRLVLATTTVLPQLFRDLGARKKHAPSKGMKGALLAGTELGFWTILVNIIQAYGLRFTSASRGAFLSQLSTVIVPIVAFLSGLEASLGWNICVASLMAILGVGVLTLDDVASPFNWKGDGVMLTTAFFAAIYILRSKVHAEKSKSGPLVPFKVISQAVFALLYLGITSGAAFKGFGLASLSSIFNGATALMIALNVGIIVWAGLFISVLATILQMRGQALVSASEAVVIFSLSPLCAAILAIPLGERFGLKGLVGASLILISTLLASRSGTEPQKAK